MGNPRKPCVLPALAVALVDRRPVGGEELLAGELARVQQPLRLLGLHPAILIPPPMIRRLAHTELLQHSADGLPRRQHRIRLTQLPHNLLRRMPLPTLSLTSRTSLAERP